MSYSVEDLRNTPTERLIQLHDAQAVNTVVGVTYYLDELARRDLLAVQRSLAANTAEVARQVDALAKLTEASGKRMARLTWVIAALTLASFIAVIIA